MGAHKVTGLGVSVAETDGAVRAVAVVDVDHVHDHRDHVHHDRDGFHRGGDLDHHLEVHHRTPRALLKLRDRIDATGAGETDTVRLWIEYEHECQRYGIDAGVPRSQLAAFIEASTIVLSRSRHRDEHAHPRDGDGHESDWQRWGRWGGQTTFRRYGSPWFALLALRRWGKIPAERLTAAFSESSGNRRRSTS